MKNNLKKPLQFQGFIPDSINETSLSKSGATESQLEFGQLKNADYVIRLDVNQSTATSGGYRIEVSLQEALSGTLRRQLHGFAKDGKELGELLRAAPSSMIMK